MGSILPRQVLKLCPCGLAFPATLDFLEIALGLSLRTLRTLAVCFLPSTRQPLSLLGFIKNSEQLRIGLDALGKTQGSSSPVDRKVEGGPIMLGFQVVLDVQVGAPCGTQSRERRTAQI